ncbi:hypothetical protein BC834DRAFT_425836 [Gloeopeniophorella convolvens]|nr:hypothetical protein BC834DRAFT_425836 [Gloeopeniophorella convolvens]
MAIHVDAEFVATQYLLCQPDPRSNEVRYLSRVFDLTTRLGAFEFMFRLYNFKPQAVHGKDGLDPDLFTRIWFMKSEVITRKLDSLTPAAEPLSKRGRGGASDAHDSESAQSGSSHDAPTRGHILDEPAILKILKASGYTLTEQVDGFELLTPMRIHFLYIATTTQFSLLGETLDA